MSIDCTGIQRACKKEDVFKMKVYHLETTAKVCEEYSKTVRNYYIFEITAACLILFSHRKEDILTQ